MIHWQWSLVWLKEHIKFAEITEEPHACNNFGSGTSNKDMEESKITILFRTKLTDWINLDKQVTYLANNFFFKGIDSLKDLIWINLSSDDNTQIFWTVILLMVVTDLQCSKRVNLVLTKMHFYIYWRSKKDLIRDAKHVKHAIILFLVALS